MKRSFGVSFILGLIVLLGSHAHADDREAACFFSKESKASLHIDPWAPADQKIGRFGIVENGDEISIQNCKGVSGLYLALNIGNREPSLSHLSANYITNPNFAPERCEFSPEISAIPWIASKADRENAMRSRLKTLRSCIAIQVTNLSRLPLKTGNHPSCSWSQVGTNTYVAIGETCTLKIEDGLQLIVQPTVDRSCLTPERFESGELQSADLTTALQAYVTADELGKSQTNLIGSSVRRIVFAPNPKLAPFGNSRDDEESRLRFSKTVDLRVQPTMAAVSIQRSRTDVTTLISLQFLVRNLGAKSSSYPVPFMAEAELYQITPGGKVSSPLANWTTYTTSQALIAADWSGLVSTQKSEIGDLALKNGSRYRVRLKYYHPSDVPFLRKSAAEAATDLLTEDDNTFEIPKIQGLQSIERTSSVGGVSPLTWSSVGNLDDSANNMDATSFEREMKEEMGAQGIDETFPPRYNRLCRGGLDCVWIQDATYIGESTLDFSIQAVPGQVGEFKTHSIHSSTKMIGDKTPSTFDAKESVGIKCK